MKASATKDITLKEKVCLIVIDGWGIRKESHGNAILNSRTPNMDKLMENMIPLEASETHVGLPEGQMGNSEVGHLNIGSGRVIYQDILRINMVITSGDIVKNKGFTNACERAHTTSEGRMHLIGLCSDGGVHAHIAHILGLVEGCKKMGVTSCYLHFVADGRDTSPTSGVGFVKQVLDKFKTIGYGTLSSVVGRFYAMDRDKKWDRIEIAVNAFCHGVGTPSCPETISEDIKMSYAKGDRYTDEFLTPFVLGDDSCRIKANDTIILCNYRSDRMRQLAISLGPDTQLSTIKPLNLKLYCMTQYNQAFTFDVLFGPESPKNVLAEWLSLHHQKQIHVAETEKYAHMTFFFNGGVDKPFELEDRTLIQSPRYNTYDLCPAMSVYEVSQKVAEAVRSGAYSFVVVNLAPPDMVGHTGCYFSTYLACEATDHGIGCIHQACEEMGYTLLVTADHGNAEMMYDEKNGPHTAHTLYPVPLIVTKGHRLQAPPGRKAALCDIAPTVLRLLGLPQPPEMGGVSLLV